MTGEVEVVAVEPVYDRVHRRLSDEHYTITERGGRVRIEACSRRAQRWAMVELARRRGDGEKDLDVADGPAFAIRGVIEGFYGTPWSDEQRLDMIDFLAAHRFNTFLYAPKDDPFLRDRWREPHAADAAAAAARDGRPLPRRRRHGDGRRLAGAVDAVLERRRPRSCSTPRCSGSSTPASITSPCSSTTSLNTFSTLPTSTRTDRWRRRTPTSPTMSPTCSRTRSCPLVVCPTVYRGAGDEEYVVTLGSLLDGRIDLFWTRAGDLLAGDHRRRGGHLRPRCAAPAAVLGQLPGQRRGDDPRGAPRPLPRTRPAARPLQRRRDGQRDGARRGVEDRPGDDRRLPLGSGRATTPSAAGSAPSPRSAARMRGRCSASPTPSAAAAWPSRTRQTSRASSSASSSISPTATPRQPGRASARPPTGWPVRQRRCDRRPPTTSGWPTSCGRGWRSSPSVPKRWPPSPTPCASAELRKLADELSSRPHVVYGSVLEMAIDRALQQHSEGEHP